MVDMYIYVYIMHSILYVIYYIMGFPGGSVAKNSANAFDPWSRKIPWRRTHSRILACEIPWTEEPCAIVHGVTESWT